MHKNLEELIQKKLLSIEELKKVYPSLNESDYTDLIYATFLHQKSNWGMFSDGWNGFLSSEYKKFQFDWFQIKVQFNPTRFVSSSAKVDEESIKKRKCFLCIENLPEEQKGILFESKSQPHERLIFLCNPAPIFNEHFTVSNVKHTPQQIFNNISMVIELAELCNNEYTVFYNGPKCGASAPDHFHFQACPAEDLITEKDFIIHPERFHILHEKENVIVRFITAENYLRNVIIISSKDKNGLKNYFQKFYRALQEINEIDIEPMMNIFALMRNDDYHIIIFPREKHRPDCYFAEGDANMLISPGLVDMCGIIITPLQKDFERINESIIRQVYSEVSLSTSKFQRLLEKLNKF
jgi:ATP adenylyltransferase/5',5'''-P-1,P-4-tetraphosphate phosphorylase II